MGKSKGLENILGKKRDMIKKILVYSFLRFVIFDQIVFACVFSCLFYLHNRKLIIFFFLEKILLRFVIQEILNKLLLFLILSHSSKKFLLLGQHFPVSPTFFFKFYAHQSISIEALMSHSIA